MAELDPRIVKVSIEVDGELKVYEGLDINIMGMKYANSNQNECEVKITNLDRITRNYILTETSPFNKNQSPKKVIVEAGRVSYGTVRIFEGDIVASIPSQPPDIALTLKALTGNRAKGFIVARTQAQQAKLSIIAKQVADDLGVSLNFQATDKQIANYSFNGGMLKQIDKLGEAGAVDAYQDNTELVVKDYNVPLKNKMRILDLDTGMIGIPEVTEQGVKVKFLLDNQTVVGSRLQITSKIYEAVNGIYVIYKLGFEIASRETPFYFVADCKRLNNGS